MDTVIVTLLVISVLSNIVLVSYLVNSKIQRKTKATRELQSKTVSTLKRTIESLREEVASLTANVESYKQDNTRLRIENTDLKKAAGITARVQEVLKNATVENAGTAIGKAVANIARTGKTIGGQFKAAANNLKKEVANEKA